MPIAYSKNKQHIYNYRAKNKETYNEYQRILVAKLREYKQSNDYENISKIFRKILY